MATSPRMTLVEADERHVAPGGIRRGVVGVLLGVGLGVLLRIISDPVDDGA